MPRLLTLALLAACQTDTPQQNLPDWSAGYDDGTSTVDTGTPEVPSGALAVTVPTNTGIESRIHVTGATDPCEIYPDGTVEGYEETDCTIDIPELDLYGYGLNYDLTVPAGACEFVVYSHYMYEAWEVGTGPDEVSYEVDATGNIVNEVNSVGGVPYCEYDYTWQSSDSPNCCIGSYTLTVYDAAADETTTSPSFRPPRISCNEPDVRPMRTSRGISVPSSARTNTRTRWPVATTALRGTTRGNSSPWFASTRICAYMPGRSVSPGLGSSTRSRAVRVCTDTVG